MRLSNFPAFSIVRISELHFYIALCSSIVDKAINLRELARCFVIAMTRIHPQFHEALKPLTSSNFESSPPGIFSEAFFSHLIDFRRIDMAIDFFNSVTLLDHPIESL